LILAAANVTPGAVSQETARVSAQEFSSAPRNYHIELSTLESCQPSQLHQASICSQNLAGSSLAVVSNDRDVPIRVVRASDASPADELSLPTHLLVLFPHGSPRPADAYILKRLHLVLQKGWLVSVTRSDRSITPYCSLDALPAELAKATATPISEGLADAAMTHAIDTLETQPGRRMLLIDIARARDKRTPQWVSSAAQSLGVVYVADRGKLVSIPYAPISSGELARQEFGISFVRNERIRWRRHGIFHEPSLFSAVRDMIADGRYDFDIQFTAPNGAPGPITLRLPNPQDTISNRITAQLYFVESKTGADNSEPVRVLSHRELNLRTE
jgi:hypothetical protein